MTILVWSCSTDLDSSLTPDIDSDTVKIINQNASSRSMCTMDWEVIESIDDDGDFCNDVSVQFNGLSGTCADCAITQYSLFLNSNGAIPNTGILNLGTWQDNDPMTMGVGKFWAGNPINTYPNFNFTSFSQIMSLIELGSGEEIEFSYLVGSYQNVELCLSGFYDCGDGIPMSFSDCELIDLICE